MTIGVGISNYAASATSVSGLNTPTGKTSQVSGSSFYIALFYVTSGAPTTVTDTFSNVYTAVTAEVQNTSDGGFMRVYQCQNGTGGANHQAGVAWTPTQLGVIMFVEVTGGATSSILDQQNCVYDSGGSPFSCVLPTTTNAPDLLLGFTIVQSANTSEAFSSPTLTNTVFSFNFSTTSLFAGAAMSARVTSTGAYDAAISDTAGYSKALVAMLALKEGGGGAPGGMRQVGLGPGTTPDTKTMFTPRPVSNFIVQGTSKAVASGQGFAVGLLTGAIIVPVIGYVRTSGPGISPDYKRTFDQIPRSTALPNFAQLTGRAFGSGYALASLTGVAAIQGLSLGQGVGVAGPLTGAGVLTGLANGEGAALGLLSSGAVSSITGVALGTGYALGTVTGAGVLRGVASAEGIARATLTATGVLTGQAIGQGFGRGTLLGSASLTGVGVGSGYAVGLVGAGGNLTGFAFGSGYALASLMGSAALTGRASGEGAARASLVGAGALSGTAHGQGSAVGLMTGIAQIQGVSLGQAYALGLVLPAGSGQMHGVGAGFSFAFGLLSGNGHTFGHCTVDALSQNGLPVARPCYIEESACFVVASYFDNTGAAFVPNAVQYRIDDVVSGANILPWTMIVPGITNEVVVTSAQNAMINNSRTSESHQVLFQVTDGFGNVTYADVSFDVIRVAGLG